MGKMPAPYKKLFVHMCRINFFSDLVSSFSDLLARTCTKSICLTHTTFYPVTVINHTFTFLEVENQRDQS